MLTEADTSTRYIVPKLRQAGWDDSSHSFAQEHYFTDGRIFLVGSRAKRKKRKYTKTAPIQFEEFADCVKWWTKRNENDRAWEVPAKQIIENGCNLDIKNPTAKEDLPPEKLVESIVEKEKRILEIMGEIKALLAERPKA